MHYNLPVRQSSRAEPGAEGTLVDAQRLVFHYNNEIFLELYFFNLLLTNVDHRYYLLSWKPVWGLLELMIFDG